MTMFLVLLTACTGPPEPPPAPPAPVPPATVLDRIDQLAHLRIHTVEAVEGVLGVELAPTGSSGRDHSFEGVANGLSGVTLREWDGNWRTHSVLVLELDPSTCVTLNDARRRFGSVAAEPNAHAPHSTMLWRVQELPPLAKTWLRSDTGTGCIVSASVKLGN